MSLDQTFTDSATLLAFRDPASQLTHSDYPPFADAYLRGFLTQLVAASGNDLVSVLPSLTEPSLYTLAVAIFRRGDGDAGLPADLLADPPLAAALRDEIRWRNCRGMGTYPTGPVRRARLVQIVSSATPLSTMGASSLRQSKMAGTCPFCGDPSFRVMLTAVRWRCFACERDGGLPEFAEHLLSASAPNPVDP